MSRTAERAITCKYVEYLMDILECGGSYTQAERKTGIAESTWRGWATGQKSPLSALEFAYNLERTTGKSLKELIDGFKQERDA